MKGIYVGWYGSGGSNIVLHIHSCIKVKHVHLWMKHGVIKLMKIWVQCSVAKKKKGGGQIFRAIRKAVNNTLCSLLPQNSQKGNIFYIKKDLLLYIRTTKHGGW